MGNFYRLTLVVLLTVTAKAQGTFSTAIISSSQIFCTGSEVTFFGTTGGAAKSYTWTVVPSKGAIFLTSVNNSFVTISFTSALNYTISLAAKNDTASGTSFKTISVARPALAAFNASLAGAGYPNQLYLTNYSTNTIKSYWSFSDAAGADSSLNTIKSYAKSGSYSVTLVSIGKNGCNDTATYAFTIEDASSVVLPNVFTPNYDGVNDVYKPLTKGISDLNVWIYNRDGVLIANWNKVNGYWDGHTTSGEECSGGQYFVIMDAQGFDGKSYKLKGNITLLR